MHDKTMTWRTALQLFLCLGVLIAAMVHQIRTKVQSIGQRDEAKAPEAELFWEAVFWGSRLLLAISCVRGWYWVRAELQGRICGDFEVPDLTGRTYCITGGSNGIGFETARLLLLAGAKVVLGVRNVRATQAKLSAAIQDEKLLSNVEVYWLDLVSFSSVRLNHARLSSLPLPSLPNPCCPTHNQNVAFLIGAHICEYAFYCAQASA